MIAKPVPEEYNEFYQAYISKLEKDDLLEVLKDQSKGVPELLNSLPPEKANYKYGEDKWTIAQLVNHLNDTERVFSYRAMAIARGEKQALPGMDQDIYVAGANTAKQSFESLIAEFEAIRTGTIILFENLEAEHLAMEGNASGFPVTPRGIAGIIAGHTAHHVQILKERYL